MSKALTDRKNDQPAVVQLMRVLPMTVLLKSLWEVQKNAGDDNADILIPRLSGVYNKLHKT